MDYEKKYKDALKRAEKWALTHNLCIEDVFPELKESEDERIRDAIKLAVSQYISAEHCYVGGIQKGEIIAWLERQKEQKPVQDETEREFVRTLKSLISDFLRGKEEVDREYYQQIYDWLDGRHIEQESAEWREGLRFKKDFVDAVYACAWDKVTCKPEGETQEEYAKRWAEHLLLMVRDWADDYIDSQIESAKRKAYDKGKTDAEKPVEWSERDKYILNNIHDFIKENTIYPNKENCAKECLIWLDSLLERGNLLPRQEWSEEDEKIRKSLVEFFGKFKPQDMWNEMISFGDVLSYLEKQKPAEWSEEDKKMRNNLIEFLIRLSANTRTDSTSINYSYPREIDWLKSLRPQSHWKPSEEQMRAVFDASERNDKLGSVLRNLYDDLKKL